MFLRSFENIFGQIIDDFNNITFCQPSIEKDFKSNSKVNKSELSNIVAEKFAKKALEK